LKIHPRNPKYRGKIEIIPVGKLYWLDVVYEQKEILYNTLGIPKDKVRK
jgi:hypothetical protein